MSLADRDAVRRSGSLCEVCRNSVVIRGFAENEIVIVCDALYPQRTVGFSVRECTAFSDRRIPKKEDLEEIALCVEPRRRMPRPGFSGPCEPNLDPEG